MAVDAGRKRSGGLAFVPPVTNIIVIRSIDLNSTKSGGRACRRKPV
jgi:hypothetical protein